MSGYACPNCRQLVQFEASACDSCGAALAYDPAIDGLRRWDRTAGDWLDGAGAGTGLTACGNMRYMACNWLVAPGGGALCRSCCHNRIIPDLAVPGVLERWRKTEAAKRRMIRGLIRIGLPLEPGGGQPLLFDMLYDPAAEQGQQPRLLTGHAGGVITLNLIEADDVARERIRHALGEPYRTLLGHFRHEVAHHYWHRLVEYSADIWPFRRLFGDERADYGAALAAHYAHPLPPTGWQDDYVSAYATVHPWEDFAETFAHYLHIVDTLQTVEAVSPQLVPGAPPPPPFDPYAAGVGTLIERWIPCAFALNAVNRSLGQRDLYPFHLAPGIMLKFDFVHRLVAFAAGRWTPGEAEGADIRALMATLGHGVQQPAP
ncbi:MAG: putative zinc-binding metallopeptidase [Sphingomonas fennica]